MFILGLYAVTSFIGDNDGMGASKLISTSNGKTRQIHRAVINGVTAGGHLIVPCQFTELSTKSTQFTVNYLWLYYVQLPGGGN